MNFMVEWQEQYLSSLLRYCSCHGNIKFMSSSYHVMFFLLYKHTDDGGLIFFRRFPTTSRSISEDFRPLSERFLKIFQTCSEGQINGITLTFL